MEKRPIEIKSQPVDIKVYVPPPEDTIKVQGPPEIVNEDNVDALEMYFESKRKSSGDEIKTIVFKAEESAVFVTFKDENGKLI